MPLIEEQPPALAALETYKALFPAALDQAMRRKLGLRTEQNSDRALVENLLQLMQQDCVDYTVFWRRLSHAVRDHEKHTTSFEHVRDLFLHREAFDAWCTQYLQRLQSEGSHTTSAAHLKSAGMVMLQNNPKFVLRNHLGELAIRQAREGDFSMLHDLLLVLHRPYDEHPQFEAWAGLAPEWANSIEISCSS
jgi:uncharacterized protein YdiU (UPF0061 family)